MKKLLAVLLALTLLLSLGVTAFASDLEFKSHDYTQGDQEPMTQLIWTEKKGASWTLNIPAETLYSLWETRMKQIFDTHRLRVEAVF